MGLWPSNLFPEYILDIIKGKIWFHTFSDLSIDSIHHNLKWLWQSSRFWIYTRFEGNSEFDSTPKVVFQIFGDIGNKEVGVLWLGKKGVHKDLSVCQQTPKQTPKSLLYPLKIPDLRFSSINSICYREEWWRRGGYLNLFQRTPEMSSKHWKYLGNKSAEQSQRTSRKTSVLIRTETNSSITNLRRSSSHTTMNREGW